MNLNLYRLSLFAFVIVCVILSIISVNLHEDFGLNFLGSLRGSNTVSNLKTTFLAVGIFSLFLLVFVKGLFQTGECSKLNRSSNKIAKLFFNQLICAVALCFLSYANLTSKFTLDEKIDGVGSDLKGFISVALLIIKTVIIFFSFYTLVRMYSHDKKGEIV